MAIDIEAPGADEAELVAALKALVLPTGGGGTTPVNIPSTLTDTKQSVRLATTANHGLSGLADIDGVTPSAADRILVKSNTTGSQNGIYDAAAGAWTRSTDADASSEVTSGMLVFVEEG